LAKKLFTLACLAVLVGAIGSPAANAADISAPSFRSTFPDSLEQVKCQTPTLEERIQMYGASFNDPSDCSQFGTNPLPEYDGPLVYEIPVVTHVVMDDSCTNGDISDEMVATQIDILNEDFLALMGSNGEEGNKTLIRFRQAKVDPAGNPTDGITRTCNTTYYNDGGAYYNELNWDPNEYMNVYTNNNFALGYVPFLPADSGGAFVGLPSDRVVVLWESFGRFSPIPNYNLGRTSTHEVGHYLGLEHTFSGGCGDADAPGCYATGDLICDTNSESAPVFRPCEVGINNSCGTEDPSDNYMDYSDDICMNKFTVEQTRRMRCTLENYRVDLAKSVTDFLTMTPADPSQAQAPNTWKIEDATPGAEVFLLVSSVPGSVDLIGCAGETLDIGRPFRIAGSFIADGDGRGSVTATPPAISGTYFYQAVDRANCSISNRGSSDY